ncbi:DUF317 domain-containing protein [Streptomyces sp. NPDC092952]|uniref:DUF317 domain-containing protein n=1 Tax=Streptomyces sp. NPDC092952 TaxID=3366018 RepID=UPI00382BEB6C
MVERRDASGVRCTAPWREEFPGYWRFEVLDTFEPAVDGLRLWHAVFDGRTPEHLVAAFATALVGPEPVAGRRPVRHPHHVAP